MPDKYICRDCGCLDWKQDYSERGYSVCRRYINSRGEVEEEWDDTEWDDNEEEGDAECNECESTNLEYISTLTSEQLVRVFALPPGERMDVVERILRGEPLLSRPPENCTNPSEEKCKKCSLAGKTCKVPIERGWM